MVNNLPTQVHVAEGKRPKGSAKDRRADGARLQGPIFHILLDCIEQVKPHGGGGPYNAWTDVHAMFRRRMQDWHDKEIRWHTVTVDAIKRRSRHATLQIAAFNLSLTTICKPALPTRALFMDSSETSHSLLAAFGTILALAVRKPDMWVKACWR